MDELLSNGQGASPESMIVPESSTPTGEGEGTPAPEQPVQPQEPVFSPTEWNLNYKGRPIQIRDRNHLVALATKGYGFDQEIDRLKKRESELNEMGTKYERYGKLDESLSQNPALAQKIFAMAQGQPAATENMEGEEPQYVTKMRRKLDELESWKTSLNNRNADQELDNELAELKKSFPQHDWDYDDGSGTLSDKILRHAHNNGAMFPSLVSAYRDFFWDNRDATIKAETLKAEQDRMAREKAQGKVGGGGPTPPPAKGPAYTPDKSYNDLANMALGRMS